MFISGCNQCLNFCALLILGYSAKDDMSDFGKVATLVYSFFGIPVGLFTIKEFSRLLVFMIQTVSFLFAQHQTITNSWKVSRILYNLVFDYGKMKFL